MSRPTLVLVHGGAHDSRCWQPTVDALHRAAPEVPVVAVDLPGRGRCPTPIADMTITTCVDAIVDQLDEVGGEEVVLVGHSMAGLAVPAAAIRLGPERVRRLVYVSCNIPPDGGSTLDSLAGPLRPLAKLAGSRVLPYSRTGLPWPIARTMFCNGMTAEQRRTVRAQLGPESPTMVRERVDRSLLDPSIPATWVLTLRDRSLSPKQQRRSIERLGGVEHLVELDACHDVMVSHPEELARVFLEEATR